MLLPVLLLLVPPCVRAGLPGKSIPIAKHRKDYADDMRARLQHGHGDEFRFGRFQSLAATKAAFEDCRSPSKFKEFVGKDGRKGSVCSTKLGGDWVLAESEQVAPACTCEQVLKAYLDGRLQRRWSADKVIDGQTSSHKPKGGEPYIRQDLVLHSQRIIRSHTGVMRYSQRITVDKVGSGNFCAFVELDPQVPSTPKKPFNSLSVYVGLQQQGADVRIYAAGVFEVNRRVVPNLVVFDASGIAGDMAGKGTLWLAGHFEERAAAAAAAAARANARRSWRAGAGIGTRWPKMGKWRERLSSSGSSRDQE